MPTKTRKVARTRSRKMSQPRVDPSTPKTTRPDAESRRPEENRRTVAEKLGRTMDAFPDRIDVRDWFYQPRLVPLPDQVVNCDAVPEILDQGNEGACTGFALAAVLNYLLAARHRQQRVSPQMLYEMARRYDQWPGEDYEGSSARGAMIGFLRHGVCGRGSWPPDLKGPEHFSPEIATEALAIPGGAFYRVMHKQIRDIHAALDDIGIVYMTLMVHEGWGNPTRLRAVSYVHMGNMVTRDIPVIERLGDADGGHAVAIVGYTRDGFIIQNSWGQDWGAGGFALLPYEDYLLHATDVWVVQLGVPASINLWSDEGFADSTAGVHRATESIPLNDIRPYAVNVGNNGELSGSGNYWTTERDVQRIFSEHIPTAATKRAWKKKRVLLYLHGGLNDEAAVARRIVAFRDVCLENEIYPLHIMWETGAWDAIKQMIADFFTDDDTRASGVGDWLRKARQGLIEAKDRTFEITTAKAGRALWSEMKENARRSSDRPDNKGGMQLIARYAKEALAGLTPAQKKEWEVHVVAHSAGSIFAAHAIQHLIDAGVTFGSLQFLAPAATVDLFKTVILPYVDKKECPPPTVYVLSNVGELDDDVGPYGKSLLYLVSNAFEDKRGMPIVGMEKFIQEDAELTKFFGAKTTAPRLVIAGAGGQAGAVSRSDSHGGFDNDPDTLNSVLLRIVGGKLKRPFETKDLQY